MEHNQKILALINEMDISPEVKQGLVSELESGGVTDSLMQKIQTALSEIDAQIAEKYKSEIAQMETAKAEYKTEVDAAATDFETEMASINSEVENVVSKANSELENIDVEEARSALQ